MNLTVLTIHSELAHTVSKDPSSLCLSFVLVEEIILHRFPLAFGIVEYLLRVGKCLVTGVGRLLSCPFTDDSEASFLLVLEVFGVDPAQLNRSETHLEHLLQLG